MEVAVGDDEALCVVVESSHGKRLASNRYVDGLFRALVVCLLVNAIENSNDLLEEVDKVVEGREGRGVHGWCRGRAQLEALESNSLEVADENGLRAKRKHVTDLGVKQLLLGWEVAVLGDFFLRGGEEADGAFGNVAHHRDGGIVEGVGGRHFEVIEVMK